MATLNVIRASFDNENRVADRESLEYSADFIAAALEKVEIMSRGVRDDRAIDALGDAINALQCLAADLRVKAGEL